MTPFWDERVAHWVARHIDGCERGFGACKALGVEHKGEIVAGVVFHNWEPEAGIIEVSGAATDSRWMTRTVINTALNYVFNDAGCQMMVARQSLDNKPARRLWLGIGGTEYKIPRLRGRDKDGSIITLTDDQWRRSKFNEAAKSSQS